MILVYQSYPYHGRWLPNMDAVVEKFKYVLVAKVAGYDLDKAFELTQNQETPWTENEEVEVLAKTTNLRSTSVGDVMFVAEYGSWWAVMPMGFRTLRKQPTMASTAEYAEFNAE